MATVPPIIGIVAGGPVWQHIPVAALWITGYCLYFTADNWLRARRRATYLPPVRFWALWVALFAAASLVAAGCLLRWAWLFIPLVLVTAWTSFRRESRSLLARSSEVIAAGLMTPVMWDLSYRADHGIASISALASQGLTQGITATAQGSRVLLVTIAVIYYFWCTIPFVKSLVREKASRAYLATSIIAHALGLAGAFALFTLNHAGVLFAIVWAVLAIRCAIFTFVARRTSRASHRTAPHRTTSQPLNAKQLLITVGIIETIISIVYIPAVLTLSW